MESENITIDEKFYKELEAHMKNGEELNVRQIYSLFPDSKSKTVSWRVHKFVQQGKLQNTRHGYSVNIIPPDMNTYKANPRWSMTL